MTHSLPRKKKKWLKPGRPAHNALGNIVLDKAIIRNVQILT
jgi:hypothetical protein